MIDVEALNQELPDGYEAAKTAVGGISISANDGMDDLGAIMVGVSEYGYHLEFCCAVLFASEISTYIEALKVIQKFMEEAND